MATLNTRVASLYIRQSVLDYHQLGPGIIMLMFADVLSSCEQSRMEERADPSYLPPAPGLQTPGTPDTTQCWDADIADNTDTTQHRER